MVGIGIPRDKNLSNIIIDCDLVMGAHDITLGAAQTVDGIDVGSDLMKKTADSDLAMGAHNITLGAAQTVDGRDVSALVSNKDNVVTGTYTGDGSASRAIATGFTTIKGVIITVLGTMGDNILLKLADDNAADGRILSTGGKDDYFTPTGFSGENFYIDDDATDRFPNQNGINYIWIAWGI